MYICSTFNFKNLKIMSKYNQGILGPFSGKVGPVVGAFWKGRYVMRVRPAHMTNPQTEDQMRTRLRLSLLSTFLSPFRETLKIGMKKKMAEFSITAVNAGIKMNQLAVTGSYPAMSVDPATVQLSNGLGFNVETPTMSVAAAGPSVNISWVNNAGVDPTCLDQDRVIVCLRNKTTGQVVMDAVSATRVDQAAAVVTPGSWAGLKAQGFIFTTNVEGDIISPTAYLGEVTINS